MSKPYSEREATLLAGCSSITEAVTEMRRAGYTARSPKAIELKWRALRGEVEQPRAYPIPKTRAANALFCLGTPIC